MTDEPSPPLTQPSLATLGRKNSAVIVRDHCVEKVSLNPTLLATKYDAVHQVGLEAGFIAPRVLAVRSDRIVLERLFDMVPLGELYLTRDPERVDSLMSNVGTVLGRLHQGLVTDIASAWSPPEGFRAALRDYLGWDVDLAFLDAAVLHCDYSFANVFVTGGEQPRIVVIDPCANYGSTFDDWTRGPVFLDIGKMLSCLEGQISARRQLRRPSPKRVESMQRRFLAGYEQASGLKLDHDVAHAFAYGVAWAQFRRRYGRLGRLHSAVLYNRFRGNFPARAKTEQA
jgi:hypothetical protein